MSDKFTAVMDNDRYDFDKGAWKVRIECNDLNTLQRICGALNLLREKEDSE